VNPAEFSFGDNRLNAMRSSLLLILFTAAGLSAASAQNFPHVPDNLRILDVNQVKNYWTNMTPEPREPNLLNRDHGSLMVDYHRKVGERHRFLQSIAAGKHDRQARLVMLRHNIQTYMLRGDDENVKKLRAELAALEAEIAAEQAVVAEAQREQDEVDRIERLIAATNRLAAALENNGGNLPRELVQEVQEIVPFEEDCDIVPNIRRDIIGHRVPIIIDDGRHIHIPDNRPQHARPRVQPNPREGKKIRPPSVHQPSRAPARSQPRTNPSRPSQPAVRQPQVQQPNVRPAQPAAKQQPAPRQPQVQQQKVRPAR